MGEYGHMLQPVQSSEPQWCLFRIGQEVVVFLGEIHKWHLSSNPISAAGTTSLNHPWRGEGCLYIYLSALGATFMA